MRLYDKRTDIINAFVNKDISFENLEPDVLSDYLEYEPEFEESVVERTKMRRQKIPDDEQPDTTDMPDLESEKSVEQRRKQKGQGLKILTPDQMLSR